MTCPHLIEGRCLLAELVARRVLDDDLQCPADPAGCRTCQYEQASAENPTRQVMACVTRVISPRHKSKWRFYLTNRLFGRQTAQRGTHRRNGKSPALRMRCVHRGREIDKFECGCSDSLSQPLFDCDRHTHAINSAAHIERAVEHLRQKHPANKQARKVRACEGCPDYQPLVPLSLSLN